MLAGPDPLRGLALMDELAATAAVLPELDGAARGRARTPTTTSTSTATPSTVLEHAARGGGRPRPLRRRARPAGRELLARAARRRAHPRRRAALRRAPPRHRQAGDPRASTAATSRSSATTGSGREMIAATLRAAAGQPPLQRAPAGAHAPPPAPRVPRPRAAALARGASTSTCGPPSPVGADVTLLTVADRLAARGEGALAARRDGRGPPRARPRDAAGGPRLASRRPAARRRSAATSSPPSWASSPGPEIGRLLGELEAAVVRRRGLDRARGGDRARRTAG